MAAGDLARNDFYLGVEPPLARELNRFPHAKCNNQVIQWDVNGKIDLRQL